MTMMKTMQQLAAWVAFSVTAVTIYGILFFM
jgi:hypothetical protein